MTDQPEKGIIHRELETDAENPAIQVAEAVADIEGKDAIDLPNVYDCVDGVLNHIFSNPPAPDAQMQVEFSYESYRITIEQNGNTKFVKLGDS
ncbi:HalOD1 output domain-containing protein [Saliphagus sp. GCM10025334]